MQIRGSQLVGFYLVVVFHQVGAASATIGATPSSLLRKQWTWPGNFTVPHLLLLRVSLTSRLIITE